MRENTNWSRLKKEQEKGKKEEGGKKKNPKRSIPSFPNGNTISHWSEAKQTVNVPAHFRDTLFLPAKLESETNLFWVQDDILYISGFYFINSTFIVVPYLLLSKLSVTF